MSYFQALKKWNDGKDKWCTPRKGTPGYKEIMEIRKTLKPIEKVKRKRIDKIDKLINVDLKNIDLKKAIDERKKLSILIQKFNKKTDDLKHSLDDILIKNVNKVKKNNG